MSFSERIKFYYRMFFKHYFNLSGRARRADYWWLTLFNFIFSILGTILFILPGIIWVLAIFIPSICLSIRRFHDRGLSGWIWLLLHVGGMAAVFISNIIFHISHSVLVSGIGDLLALGVYVVIFIVTILPSQKGENKYGFSPVETEDVLNRFKAVETAFATSFSALSRDQNAPNIFALGAELERSKMLFEDILLERKRVNRMIVLQEVLTIIEQIRHEISPLDAMKFPAMQLEQLENQLRALPSPLLG